MKSGFPDDHVRNFCKRPDISVRGQFKNALHKADSGQSTNILTVIFRHSSSAPLSGISALAEYARRRNKKERFA